MENQEIQYLSLIEVIPLHAFIMEKTGEPPASLRDEGLLESAIMRPQTAAYYEGADLMWQAALLIVGISQNQAFASGNKRTAFIVGDVFLRLNGSAFSGDPLDLAEQLVAVAKPHDGLEEATTRFEAWLRNNVAPLDQRP